MDRTEAMKLACRTLALLIIVWALSDATYLPERSYELWHYSHQVSVLGLTESQQYFAKWHALTLATNIVRVLGLLIAAAIFWRRGTPQSTNQ